MYGRVIYAINIRKLQRFVSLRAASLRQKLLCMYKLYHIRDSEKGVVDDDEWSIFAVRPSDNEYSRAEWLLYMIALRSDAKRKTWLFLFIDMLKYNASRDIARAGYCE
jgi:hypothetical protein